MMASGIADVRQVERAKSIDLDTTRVERAVGAVEQLIEQVMWKAAASTVEAY